VRTMRRLAYPGSGSVVVEEVPVPEPGPDQALIRVRASPLCGSERQALLGGQPGNAGHEAAGVIEQLPPGSPFAVGELVGMSAVTGCGSCDRCLAGRETQCRNGVHVSGGWHAEYAVAPLSALRPVGDLDPTTAALLSGDALGVPGRVARRFPPAADAEIAVIGLGPVGLGHVLVQSFAGAHVIGIEPSPARRRQALRLGAAEVYEPGAYAGRPATVIECTGVAEVVESALELVDSSGLVIQSGECHRAISLVPSDVVVHREITYTGSWFYASEDYPYMRQLLADGLPLRELCTHEVSAERAEQTFRDFLDGLTGKVVVTW
jgi:threonine dehydrogenase-like Zn-dependent dehydrogenase